MAKLKAIDQAVVITSTLTNGELQKATKYFPETLTLTKKNEDDKSVPYFVVTSTSSVNPTVSKFGIEFPKGEKDEKASITVSIPKLCKKARVEYVKDNFGVILQNLNKVEEAYAKDVEAFDKAYAELDKSIDIE